MEPTYPAIVIESEEELSEEEPSKEELAEEEPSEEELMM